MESSAVSHTYILLLACIGKAFFVAVPTLSAVTESSSLDYNLNKSKGIQGLASKDRFTAQQRSGAGLMGKTERVVTIHYTWEVGK